MGDSQHFRIRGTGRYLPDTIVTADEIDARCGVEPGWTMEHVGVVQRRRCDSPDSLANMAMQAACRAVEDAGGDWSSIDLIIDASTCRRQPIPCNAAILQSDLGECARGIPCLDVQSTCLGFLVALDLANGWLAIGDRRRVLIVCAEVGLQGMDWSQPESAALIGDGAAAVVLERCSPTPTWLHQHETFGEYREACEVIGGGHRLPPFDYSVERDADYRFRMAGPRLFRIALKHLPPLVQRVLGRATCDMDRLVILPHQASPRGVEAVRRSLKWPKERYIDHVARFGNLAAASIPFVLDLERRAGRLPPGTPLLMLGTSAGYSQAATLIEL